MASAVSGWSPVIMTGTMPAVWHRLTASLASSRGGSIMPTSPAKIRWLSFVSCCATSCLYARPRTQSARAAISCAACRISRAAPHEARSCPLKSSLVHFARITSGRPLYIKRTSRLASGHHGHRLAIRVEWDLVDDFTFAVRGLYIALRAATSKRPLSGRRPLSRYCLWLLPGELLMAAQGPNYQQLSQFCLSV